MADTKLIDLTAIGTPTTDDLLYLVDDPGGTPRDRKMTIAQLQSLISGLVQIQKIVTSGSQATVDFAAISGVYTSLLVSFSARDTTAGTSASNMYVKFNNDGTSGNYAASQRVGTQNGAIGGLTQVNPTAAGMYVANIPNDGNTAGWGVHGELWVHNYSETNFLKTFIANWRDEFASTRENYQTSAYWNSAVALTQMTFSGGTAFKDGSIFTLYGLK